MMKIIAPELFRSIKEFLTVYLPIIRKKSDNTISSYRDAIKLYLDYIQESYNKPLASLIKSDFNQENIQDFMDWLASNRNNVASTINQRLSHIRVFCRYLMKNDFISYDELNNINEIAKITDTRIKKLIWLSINDLKLVIEQPDIRKKTGIRDKFYIILLYESGCRNQEILNLNVKDFVINDNGEAVLHIVGKRNKYRVIPITIDVVKIFYDYCKSYHPNFSIEVEAPLFYTSRKGIVTKMSADNVQRFLRNYEDMAKISKPDLPHLHPHLLRTTRAMHLYLAGVPLPLIAEWLGHSQLETTRIYASATVEMKRKAIEKLALNEELSYKKNVTFKYADNDEILRRLCGLK